MIHFQHEDKTVYLKNKKNFSMYFINLEKTIEEFLVQKITPMIERVEIDVIRRTDKVAILHVKGDKTGICYEIITITSSEKPLQTPFFECIFQLYYSGYRVKKEDLTRYSDVRRKKEEDYHIFSLLPSTDISLLKNAIKHYPFEVTYEREGAIQTYLIHKKENEKINFFQQLINRTKTHHVCIKVYQNPLMEMYKLAKENKCIQIRN